MSARFETLHEYLPARFRANADLPWIPSTMPGKSAKPLRFFKDVVLPLSATNVAALFVILFIYGWNQYLWPLLMVSNRDLETVIVGLTKMIGIGDTQNQWNLIMTTAVFALLPPVAVVVLMQRWFIKGLTETEK